MNIERIHAAILRHAAELANRDERIPPYIRNTGGVFRAPAPCKDLALEWDIKSVEGAIQVAKKQDIEPRTHDEVISDFAPVITDAIVKALLDAKDSKNQSIFVGLIIDQARNDESYIKPHDVSS